jgi:hypothetical protein
VNSFTKQVEECSASDPLVEWGYSRPASHGLFSRANLLPLLAASFLPPAAVKVRVVKEERAERGELQTSGNASSAYPTASLLLHVLLPCRDEKAPTG